MNIGDLDREIKILRNVEIGRDELNAPIYEQQVVYAEWAQQIYKSTDEEFAASEVYAKRVLTFRTWYLPDVTEADALQCDGLTYNIVGVRELGFREGTEIAAQWIS